MKICSIEDCEKKAVGRGLCMMHFKRLRRNGTTEIKKGRKKGRILLCTTEGCTNKHNAHGLCVTCQQRKRREQGLCYICGKENSGGVYCITCREKVNAYKRERRKNAKESK